MSASLVITPEAPYRDGSRIVVPVVIEGRSGRSELWYRVDEAIESHLTQSADPFVLASLFDAMLHRQDMHVRGVVSTSLLRNLEDFQNVWHCWDPERYAPIQITADTEVDDHVTTGSSAIMCFSGGLDSTFSLYRHYAFPNERWSKKIGAAIFIHGADIPVANEADALSAFGKAESICRLAGTPLMRVTSNFRAAFSKGQHHWEDTHAALILSCLHLCRESFHYGLLASTEQKYRLKRWGSTALTDPMLSSDGFEVVCDGPSFSRIEKVELVSHWRESLPYLRVCWEGGKPDRNCGRCEKCIRTVLGFRAVGAGLPSCFDKDVTDEEISTIPIRSNTQRDFLRDIVDAAEARQMGDSSWVKAIKNRVKSYDRSAAGRSSISDRARNLFGKVRNRVQWM